MIKVPTASLAHYEQVASEYYESNLHPTCHDLSYLSKKLLIPILQKGLPEGGFLVELGPGVSTLAPEAAKYEALSRVVLIDNSPGMLSYSEKWETEGARLLIGSAFQTTLPSNSTSLIVASLGDPYNIGSFWLEAARILVPEGKVIFTTPSFEWSSRFRSENHQKIAKFVCKNGESLSIPSLILERKEQTKLIEAAGFSIVEHRTIGVQMLEGTIAPKLSVLEPDEPAVTVYITQLQN